MQFEVGETVVYPHHRAATISTIKTRVIKGVEKTYLQLRVRQGDLVIDVPAENIDLVGVRDVIGKDGVDRVFVVPRADLAEEQTNGSRRFTAKTEKRMLVKARQVPVSELALAEGTDESAATPLDQVLAS
ncbi:CarD family transcriptional regulator [Microbacteriaceae bacterium VKM Ac-2855]|nr:CarD family transcriptional regulator [Microbacteriaceae bacterium VKM Ac-2855]